MNAPLHRLLRALFGRLGPIFPRAMGRVAFWLWFRPHRRRASGHSIPLFGRADSTWMEVARKKIAVYRWGSGTSVLLVHGWSSRAAHMAAFVMPLEEAGFSVIAFDAPAHGRSTGARTDVWEIAETLVRLEEEHGPFEGIITHSMGALASATAMASGALQVRRMVCVAPALKQTNFVDGFARIVGLPEPVAANLAVRIEAMTGAAFWDRAVIPVPTLLMHDSADEFIPMAHVEALRDQWPAAQLMPTRGLGHLVGILTDLRVVKRAVEFVVGRSDVKQHA